MEDKAMFAWLFSWFKPSKEKQLLNAVVDGRAETVQQLLQEGADPNTNAWGTFQPLNWSSWSGQADLVKTLIAAGADLNAKNANGCTPLMSAAIKGHMEAIRQLLTAGADPK